MARTASGEPGPPLDPGGELDAVKRFPEGNPNPVLQVGADGALLYANPASAPIVAGLGLELGGPLPEGLAAELREALRLQPSQAVELPVGDRWFSLVPVEAPELDVLNLYGTDVTALRAIDKFPDENPNPVLRLTRDGRLQYANPASAPLTRVLGVGVGELLPADFRARVDDVVARASDERLELHADGRTYELRVVSVYEFDFVNLYGTDVTAARAVEQASRENERLLLAILPPSIAERLRAGETTIADGFDDMSVLFADLVGFTELSGRLPVGEVVRILNDVFSAYDELADRHGLEKIKTIGDAYMAVGGLAPTPDGGDHAEAAAAAALAIVEATERVAAACGEDVRVRVGLHTGPTVAGVIGMRKFIYDVWGDAVNQASRMESSGVPDRVQVTEATYRRLRASFAFEPRGELDVKGLGRVATYFLLGPRA